MFVLRFVKSLNKVANQNRTWERLFCIANLDLYKGCWGGEMVALLRRPGFTPAFLQLASKPELGLKCHGFITRLGQTQTQAPHKEAFPH